MVLLAFDEQAKISDLVVALVRCRLIGEVVVVDDASCDETADRAAAAGATVIASGALRPGQPGGKGTAMRRAAEYAVNAEIVVFLDADITGFSVDVAVALIEPLVADPSLMMATGAYERPLFGHNGEGGRVNALTALPLLRRFRPELARLRQPLSGEYAIRAAALRSLVLEPGYGVEIGLLIDICDRYGPGSIVEVDLGRRVHRNRPLRELGGHADAIRDAVLSRC